MRDRAPATGETVVPWLWRGGIVVVAVAGLLLGSNATETLTVETNGAVIAYFLVLLANAPRGAARPRAPRLKGAITAYALLVGVAYHVILLHGANPIPYLFTAPANTATTDWSNFLLHYAVPTLVFLDWIIWGPRGRVRWRDGMLWSIFPLGYLLVILVRGTVLPQIEDRYPYPFIDPTMVGWSGVAVGVLQIVGIYVIVTVVVIGLDHLLSRLGRVGSTGHPRR